MVDVSITLPPSVLQKYLCNTFVETGTFDGRTVQMALDAGCRKIYSIETDLGLYEQAYKRFSKLNNVFIYHEDSIDILPSIINSLGEKSLFWLDSHMQENYRYGKFPIPLLHELEIISKDTSKVAGTHTIMIDDMRLFSVSGSAWQNVTSDDVLNAIFKINNNYTIVYEDSNAAPRDILVAYLEENYQDV